MPSPDRGSFAWLLRKDFRELYASRAFWLMRVIVGLLVGHAFATATETYAELSGAAGGTAVLAQGLRPLDGIVVPTFGAFNLAAVLLLPFVVIRLIAGERQSGGMRLLVQAVAPGRIIASKLIVLLLAWVITMVPGFIALAMWSIAGGHLHAPEVITVIAGHLVLAAITIGVGLAAGAIAASPASAAILALAVTLGAWAVDFAAAVQGGWVAAIAPYTPSAVLRTFEHGELRIATVLIALLVATAGAWIAAVFLDAAATARSRVARAATVIAFGAVGAIAISLLRSSADVSEDRRNSFPAEHERTLRSIRAPLSLTVHLAGEDPRRADLDRELLARLRRVMDVDVRYVATGSTGLASGDPLYGDMIYSIGAKSDTMRSVIPAVVLETIYKLGGVAAPDSPADASSYPGYPLTRPVRGIAVTFFLIWPLLIGAGWWKTRRTL